VETVIYFLKHTKLHFFKSLLKSYYLYQLKVLFQITFDLIEHFRAE